jgi:hypothetical protein
MHSNWASHTKEIKKYAQSLKLKSEKDWRQHTKSKNFPKDIPKIPSGSYKNKGWKSWYDFLGTGRKPRSVK